MSIIKELQRLTTAQYPKTGKVTLIESNRVTLATSMGTRWTVKPGDINIKVGDRVRLGQSGQILSGLSSAVVTYVV